MTEIPELEKLAKIGKMRGHWTDDEDDTIRRYYGKVSPKDIVKFLNNRSEAALRQRVAILKSLGRWR